MTAALPAVQNAKARLDQGRAAILERHRAGAGGQEVVRSISTLTDEVVGELFASICGEGDPPLALVATGGYGRRELAPRSDVDLLALLPDEKDPRRARADQIAEHLHRALWDAGLEAGYAARTLDQCVQLAREDHTIRTALLDGRLVAGDAQLFRGFERTTVTELEARRVEEFISEKLEEYTDRRKRYGGSVWLLEPHLKQGKGGLRDLQAALWIARVRHKVAGLGEAGERGLLPAREVTAARAARDLLWRFRNELHYTTGRRDDRLTFDNQRKLAQALGYQDDPGGELGVEKLMRAAFIALLEIARASDALIDRCAVEDAPKPIFGRRAPKAQPIDAAFKIWNGRVTVNDREVFARRPADLVRIYAVAETHGLPVYSYARDLLVHELQRIGPQLASDREAHFEFWQVLVREGSDGSALLPLHELGVIGALFPEVERLRARAQHSLYHVYTVDTHTVFALYRMIRLRAGVLGEEEPELTRVARAQQRPLVLMLGLLFHDLGKGLGPDHSARGAELVRAYAERIGLDPVDARDVEWLVLAHLRMSMISQRRDLEDAALIESFAREVETAERLEMLYLLTYVDMASVSPENWTRWKGNLLRTLFEKTHASLLSEGLGPVYAQSLEERRERLAQRIAPLAGEQAAAVSEFVKTLPERYLGIARPESAARHLKLWTVARRTGFASELHRSEVGEADLTLLAHDRPGLLALFTAALAANGMDILGAEVNSLEGAMALDTFVVREVGGGAPSQTRWEAARADLLRLLSGAEDPHQLVQKRLRRASWASTAAPAVETKVRVDDVSSAEMTILDVITQDRPGLLHTIADALHRAGVSIEVARIATEGNRATDAFYLRDLSGARSPGRPGKISDPARCSAVVAAVHSAIVSLAGRG
jgi:[protein-PII] uridylyltransferase